MVTNQIMQKSIEELRDITKVEISIYDLEGTKVCGTSKDADVNADMILYFVQSPADTQEAGGIYYMRIKEEGRDSYILTAKGAMQETHMIAKIAVNQLQALLIAYREKYDRNNFFQNLILDNLLRVDIYNKAKKLHLEVERKRIVYLVETKTDQDSSAMELLRSLFSQQNGDYVTSVDERRIVVIKSLKETEAEEEIILVADTIVDMMNAEAMLNVRVSYGTVVKELGEVSKSYKEAKMALDVGKIFYIEKNVIGYSNLGIGRLIYQLPVNLCKMFMKEIFGNSMPEQLDEEILVTIQKFFENSLNISETARQLYIHRNTLVYRIEKLQKETGLDIRNFDDALTFKIALMVVSYLDYLEKEQ